MNAKDNLKRVRPTLRFRLRRNRRLVTTPEAIVFLGRSYFYHCPRCSRKTLVHWKKLDVVLPTDAWPHESPPSPFPPELRFRFGEIPERSLAYDFYCQGCRAPVRLLFWIEEHYGMGGPWYPTV